MQPHSGLAVGVELLYCWLINNSQIMGKWAAKQVIQRTEYFWMPLWHGTAISLSQDSLPGFNLSSSCVWGNIFGGLLSLSDTRRKFQKTWILVTSKMARTFKECNSFLPHFKNHNCREGRSESLPVSGETVAIWNIWYEMWVLMATSCQFASSVFPFFFWLPRSSTF